MRHVDYVLHKPTGQQKMACLPKDQLEPAPPFSFCTVISDRSLSKKKEVKLKAMESCSRVGSQEVFI